MGRYIPNTSEEQKEMLKEIGLTSFDELYQMVPSDLIIDGPLDLEEGLSELELVEKFKKIGKKNKVYDTILRGAGAYNHYTPAMVNHVLSDENFKTSYTPYQAEISQGLLQSIFEYQTMICELTDMDVSNASVYDGATAAAEALAMTGGRRRNKVLVSEAIKPQTLEVIKTYTFGNEMELVIIPEVDGVTDLKAIEEAVDKTTASIYIEYPNYYGNIEDIDAIRELIHGVRGKLIMGTNPISLAILKTPGEWGADIVTGDGQPMGLPMAFGGPYVGYMASTKKLMRKLPGRVVGQTVDRDGNRCFVLTLQAREQHIRREKASSNICSNQALCALGVSVYMATLGPKGMKKVANLCASKAHYFAKALEDIGFTVENKREFFHEFVTSSKVSSKAILEALDRENILGGLPLDDHRILWCVTELVSKEDMDRVVEILKEVE